ncbi:phosphoenolpyruvate synthase [Paenibacillus sp. LMG 31456]|uniref:Phosphoenolpyruvate synthase n=2 Tax=Paenibacillus foliorum TaxID=2654974 RepID=A0A972GPD1_9BACL|nr:phosphoenolpyruvate synthase [Paenibacillus foliorum]
MDSYVLDFQQIDKTSLPLVGGKGANLGEMTRAGFPIPAGFCVTTGAFRAFLEQSDEMEAYFLRLEEVKADQLDEIAVLGRSIRDHLVTVAAPAKVLAAIMTSWRRSGEAKAYAVRSSATAEDLPTASFAGQQDTYLNVLGEEQLLQAIRKCWASLFTDRAISYRAKNGFDHRAVLLSVVVQQMVFPEVSGIMFTADPISGHRSTISIDAGFGLGEALVSGLVSADLYQVRAGEIIAKKIAKKKLAIYPLPEGGTVTQQLSEDRQEQQALSDLQIIELAAVGERIEKHYGSEQDIEWCYAEGRIYVVQSRPITSLYPLPQMSVPEGESPHILLSFGHQQMMTNAMRPLALSVLRTMIPFGKAAIRSESSIARIAGGRMFLDITKLLTLKPARRILPKVLSGIDELIGSGVAEFVQRDSFIRNLPRQAGLKREILRTARPIVSKAIRNLVFADTSQGVREVNDWMTASLKVSRTRLAGAVGPERVMRVQEQAGMMLRALLRNVLAYPLAGIISLRLIMLLTEKWLGDIQTVHVLNKSLAGNVTSEMGLMIGDLADTARRYPQVAEIIRQDDGTRFRSSLQHADGGAEFIRQWDRFMQLYGMRCPGEIDITQPRWSEDESLLLPAIHSHMRTMEEGEHRERFAQGAIEAEEATRELIGRLRDLPFGWFKAKLMSRLIQVFRNLMAIREHPKYLMIQMFGIIRRALLDEARLLVEAGVLRQEEDVYYLTLDELLQLTQGEPFIRLDERLAERKREYERFRTLTPPRLMTSEGEIITGRRKQKDAPEGALLGTPVSVGVVEGFARVVLRPEEAKLNKGEILIAPFSDPGWTPLFHSAIGLVMEVGGLMTHGAVVAREYGLPAVVGIDGATERIKDGDYIRLDGTRGFVLILKPHGFKGGSTPNTPT